MFSDPQDVTDLIALRSRNWKDPVMMDSLQTEPAVVDITSLALLVLADTLVHLELLDLKAAKVNLVAMVWAATLVFRDLPVTCS